MPAFGPVVALAAKLATSKAGRKVARDAAAAIAGVVGTTGAAGLGRAQAARRQRTLAHKLARQVRGQLSEAVFIGSPHEHWVVWKDGVPLAAFPAVEGELPGRAELAHVTDVDRFDPPALAAAGERRTVRERLPKPPRLGRRRGGDPRSPGRS